MGGGAGGQFQSQSHPVSWYVCLDLVFYLTQAASVRLLLIHSCKSMTALSMNLPFADYSEEQELAG
jgi:hypothetical protein